MWHLLTENPKTIQSIYGEKIPSLQDINLREVKIINGEDVQCYLKFDTKELPKEKPLKWVERNVNTVQIELLLVKTEILFFEIIAKFLIGDMQIELIEDYKKVSLISKGKVLFTLKAKWLNIQSVTGYATE